MTGADHDEVFLQAFRDVRLTPLLVSDLALLVPDRSIGTRETAAWVRDARRRGIVERQGDVVSLTAAGERAARQDGR